MKKIIFSILLTAGLFNTLHAAASTDTTAAQDIIKMCRGAYKLFSGFTEEEVNQVLTQINRKCPSPEARNNHIKNLVAHVDDTLSPTIRFYLMQILPVGKAPYWNDIIKTITGSGAGPSAVVSGADAADATADPLIAGACFDPYAAAAAAADMFIVGSGANPYGAAAAAALPRATATAGAGSAAAAISAHDTEVADLTDNINPHRSPDNYRMQATMIADRDRIRPPVVRQTSHFSMRGGSDPELPPSQRHGYPVYDVA